MIRAVSPAPDAHIGKWPEICQDVRLDSQRSKLRFSAFKGVSFHFFLTFAPLSAYFLKCHICTLNYTFSVSNGENYGIFTKIAPWLPESRRKGAEWTDFLHFHTLKCKRVGKRRLAKGNDMVLSNICTISNHLE